MLAAVPDGIFSNSFLRQDEDKNIEKVHLLFKTHLDIGFTDLAANVIDKYIHKFMPMAISLARTSRLEGDSRFVWTTGSWLIWQFLERADKNARKSMEEAIAAGDVVWHGLPFTTHTELLSPPMLKAGMNIAKILDKRFGRTTIAGKMTDVPGHTRSLVPVMREEGLIFLHIGVNPASAVPDVPGMFRWRTPVGEEIMVMYQGDYGGIMVLPDGKTAVSIVFTGDNHGPQSAEEVHRVYKKLRRQFPNAAITPSDLNAVARDLAKMKDRLPVVTQEIGDSWIHGAGSDPRKIVRFRELMKLRQKFIEEGSLKAGSPEDMAFAIPLAMVAEHTWGLDVKSHLRSWDIYAPDKFEAARPTAPFQKMEKSWNEKRAYIRDAINALPEQLKTRAAQSLQGLQPQKTTLSSWKKTDLSAPMDFNKFRIAFDPATGAVVSLTDKGTGRQWSSVQQPLALMAYQTFDQSDYERFFDQYFRVSPQWALDDFGKHGLENTPAESRTWLPQVTGAYRKEDAHGKSVILQLAFTKEGGGHPYGSPAMTEVRFDFPESAAEMGITLNWFGKKANRLPEALWFSFVPELRQNEHWLMDKSGLPVDPRDVVRNGGMKMHGVQSGVWLKGENALKIMTEDAPMVSPAGRNLLNFDNKIPDPQGGMHFCLYNNVWGTNFTMWFEDDMKFRFRLKFG